MKLILAMAVCGLMSQAAFADEMSAPAATQRKGNGPCSQIKLTDAEKASLKTARANYQTANAPLKAAVKAARQGYFKMATDPKTASADALTSSQALADSMSKMQATRLQFQTEVLFNVLTQEQRKPYLQCQALRKKFRQRSHGQGQAHHNQKPSQQQS